MHVEGWIIEETVLNSEMISPGSSISAGVLS